MWIDGDHKAMNDYIAVKENKSYIHPVAQWSKAMVCKTNIVGPNPTRVSSI